jgi:shikimate dehydrogenase
MKKACVIGWPVSHSRSPLIHNYWLTHHKIAGTYERVPVEPSKLAGFLDGFASAGYVGCNVTLPHKEEAFRLVTVADESTRRLGVVNTIYLREGLLFGTSTDGEGFLANLRSSAPSLNLRNKKAVVLGAGGAAMAILGALLDEGVAEITLANRTMERSQSLRDKFGSAVRPIAWQDRADGLIDSALLVNATALGMIGQPPLEIDLDRLPAHAAVADIVYAPLVTALLKRAKQRGLQTIDGLGMLLHQAVPGFALWFGKRPTVSKALYDLVAGDLDPGYRR